MIGRTMFSRELLQPIPVVDCAPSQKNWSHARTARFIIKICRKACVCGVALSASYPLFPLRFTRGRTAPQSGVWVTGWGLLTAVVSGRTLAFPLLLLISSSLSSMVRCSLLALVIISSQTVCILPPFVHALGTHSLENSCTNYSIKSRHTQSIW